MNALLRDHDWQNDWFQDMKARGGGGGWIILDGVCKFVQPEVWNLYEFLRIFLPQKMTDLTVFSKFSHVVTHFSGFFCLKKVAFTIFSNSGKMLPSSKDFAN